MLVFQKIQGKEIMFPPNETAIGSMLQHITVNARVESFQPMNINFGLFDTKDAVNAKGRPLKNKEKKEFLYNRAKNKMDEFLEKLKK
jgi:methylenetetrahydrofolate--tRNA-(uracil-5-)-methyltransferase